MKIQDFFESVGKGGCLSMCYIKAVNKDITETEMFNVLWKAAAMGIINAEDECFVSDAIALMRLVNPNKKYTVIKQSISSLEDLKGKLAAVNFKNMGYNHFVLVEDGKIIFNSLEDSKCVKYGKPTTARIITIEDK